MVSMERYLSFKKKFIVLLKGWFQWNDNFSFKKTVLQKDLIFWKRSCQIFKGSPLWKETCYLEKKIFKYYDVFLERNIVMSPCLEKRVVVWRKASVERQTCYWKKYHRYVCETMSSLKGGLFKRKSPLNKFIFIKANFFLLSLLFYFKSKYHFKELHILILKK